MNFQNIKDPRLRAIFTGSPTPAQDFISLMRYNDVDAASKADAIEYFRQFGGVYAAADKEIQFGKKHDL